MMTLTIPRAALSGVFALAAGSALSFGQAPAGDAAPTFSKDVAPIVYSRCASCHRPGEVAPMSLLTFREVRPWAASIREKVSSRAMPPWYADRQHGTFRNDASLTESEIDTIVRWVDAGAREGAPADLPPTPAFPEGWQIGTPDVVFEMQTEFDVPARGTIDYQYFEVPTNFTTDRWMQAGEVRAGDRGHVHHIIVYVREPSPVQRPNVMTVTALPSPSAGPPPSRGTSVATAPRPAAAPPRPVSTAQTPLRRTGDNMLVNWAVGEDAPVFLPGMAKRIPAGSTLVFQVHYTTNGTPGRDRSKVGLIFAKEPPPREVRTGMILNAGFAIPPGATNHPVEAEATFTADVKVWSMHPHMHLRGKNMTYTAQYPDGRREIVLRVPKFDFGWQTDYWLASPLTLPTGSTLRVSAHFDNSAANRSNPDPSATVRWGDQTWEEMMIGFFTYTVEGLQAATAGGVTSPDRRDAGPPSPTARTPWGEPDLQGTWSSEAELSVPFERPRQFGERQLLTDEEFTQRQAQTERQLQSDNSDFDLETADRSTVGQVGSATSPPPHWLERSKVSRRTSLVIDPSDGRIPPLIPEAQKRAQGPSGTFGSSTFSGPQDLSLWERCISRGMPGAIFPTVYNANVRIVQGPGYVALTYEMIHDTRVIPTGGAPPPAPGVHSYFGQSRGRWDGNTLVVEVSGFNDGNSYRGARDNLKLVERFTRVSPDGLRYQVTAVDPQTWTRPWTAALDMASKPEGLFEYACHEGNHSMRNILSAARAAER